MAARNRSVFAVTTTGFDAAGRLDAEHNRFIFDRLAAAGVGAYIGSASPGEGHSLSAAETEALFVLARDTMGTRAPARAMGAEPRSAEALLPTIRLAEQVGLDAMQLYSVDVAHGNSPNPAELERYFRTLLEAMTIPAVISSHVASGYLVPIEVADRLLADYRHLIGFNVTSPDMGYVKRFVQAVDGRADVHVGGPMQALNVLSFGGQGFLCTEAMFIPEECSALVRAWESGDLAACAASYDRIMSLFALNRWPGGSLRFIKASFEALGWGGSGLRPPWLPLPAEQRAEVAAALRAFGLRA